MGKFAKRVSRKNKVCGATNVSASAPSAAPEAVVVEANPNGARTIALERIAGITDTGRPERALISYVSLVTGIRKMDARMMLRSLEKCVVMCLMQHGRAKVAGCVLTTDHFQHRPGCDSGPIVTTALVSVKPSKNLRREVRANCSGLGK